MLLMAAVVFASCSDIPAPYELFDKGGNSDIQEPVGDGTFANPFNGIAANNYIENGGDENATMYVKGIVYSIDIDTSYGNATYYISDDGTSKNKFEIYRGYSLNGDKFKSDDEVKAGDEVIVAGKLVNYNGTFEMTQGSKIVSLNGSGSGGGNQGTPGEAKGAGTQADPYNATAANAFIATLASDQESANDIYVKGIVVEVKEAFSSYGNATFYIADSNESADKFYCFRALGLGNKKCTDPNALKVGDEVVVCGKVVNYKGNTPETVQNKAYLYSVNGKTEEGGGGNTQPDPTPGSPSGNGTLDSPYNATAANNYVSSLAADVESDKDVYVSGVVVEVKEAFSSYGNATFYIADNNEASDKFYCFRALGLGNQKCTDPNALKVGDKVVVCGKVVNYKGNTPETVQNKAYLYSVNGNTTYEPGGNGGNDNPGGNSGSNAGVKQEGTTVILTNSDATAGNETITCTLNTYGWENAKDPAKVTLSDGTTIEFGKGESTNAPKYYDATNGVRMYAKNTLTINGAKKIATVILECDSYQGTNYVGNPTMTVSFSGNNCIMVNDHTQNSGGVQCRVKNITITYAK